MPLLTEATALRVGSTAATAAYLGTVKVWPGAAAVPGPPDATWAALSVNSAVAIIARPDFGAVYSDQPVDWRLAENGMWLMEVTFSIPAGKDPRSLHLGKASGFTTGSVASSEVTRQSGDPTGAYASQGTLTVQATRAGT